MADVLSDRLKIAADTFREDGMTSLPALLEEAAAVLSRPPALKPVASLRISNWPTGPEYGFEPGEGMFELPVGEYRLYPIGPDSKSSI